jgi:hypothetical protein
MKPRLAKTMVLIDTLGPRRHPEFYSGEGGASRHWGAVFFPRHRSDRLALQSLQCVPAASMIAVAGLAAGTLCEDCLRLSEPGHPTPSLDLRGWMSLSLAPTLQRVVFCAYVAMALETRWGPGGAPSCGPRTVGSSRRDRPCQTAAYRAIRRLGPNCGDYFAVRVRTRKTRARRPHHDAADGQLSASRGRYGALCKVR